MTFKVPEQFRVLDGAMGSSAEYGNNGAFIIPNKGYEFVDGGYALNIVASDGLGWEHVSVSKPNSTPSWDEMCHVKQMFWGPSDCVIQYHPAEADYVNCHPHCLHLWRPVGVEIPRPPPALVGGGKSKTDIKLRSVQ